MKIKAVIYARVSSREQEDTGYSLDAQEKLLKEYALKKDFDIARVFRVSESASGKQIRKIFTEMVQYAIKHKITIVLCEKIDRLTRNPKDALEITDWFMVDEQRSVHFVKENFIVNKNTKAHENLVWDMKVAIARFYTNNLSEEVKKGQKEKIAQGWLPQRPPLGYKTLGEKGHKYHVVDEITAPFIRKAFELYATGNYSLNAIAEKLYADGFRTRAGKKPWKSRIEDMLKEPFYYGAIRWNDVIHQNGKHEPLITKEIFDKVQQVMKRGMAPKYSKHQFQFRKMMTCAECKGTVTAEIQKGKVYYHCSHYHNCSQKKYSPEDQIESQLMGVFEFFEAITSEEAEQIKEKIKQNHAQEIEYKESTLKALQTRYNQLQRRLDVLYDDRLDEKISPERWELKQKEITNEQATIQEQIQKLKAEEAKYFEIWLNIMDLARRAREIYEKRSPEERRLLLTHIFSNLMLNDGKVLPTLKKPVAVLAKRVQQKLDQKKIFERQKSIVNADESDSFDSLTNPLLLG